MDFNIEKGSVKYIILESVYYKLPYEIFDAIWKADHIESVSDLKSILNEEDYKSVLMCVRMRYLVQALSNYTEFLNVIGGDSDSLGDGLIYDWDI